MSNFKIRVANFFAKNSCDMWQKVGIIRRICRKLYRNIMEKGAKSYPYDNPEFANWPESDEIGKYTLVSDSDGFVIRRSTSYINWLIKTEISQHLKLPTPGKRLPGEHKFDAKHWDEILEYNGWKKETPIMSDSINQTHFVGIIPDDGEFGQLVWFRECDVDHDRKLGVFYVKGWETITYERFHKSSRYISADDKNIIWYRQPKTLLP